MAAGALQAQERVCSVEVKSEYREEKKSANLAKLDSGSVSQSTVKQELEEISRINVGRTYTQRCSQRGEWA